MDRVGKQEPTVCPLFCLTKKQKEYDKTRDPVLSATLQPPAGFTVKPGQKSPFVSGRATAISHSRQASCPKECNL